MLIFSCCIRHLEVDVYGTGWCSDPGLKCDRSQEKTCLEMLDTSYKVTVCLFVFTQFSLLQFYLALENSLCTDYVTEKFWMVLDYNVIPVVLNGVNMSNIAPKHSYIDFKDFNNSIEETAEYMKRVSADDELFASYFWWRDYYSPTQSTEDHAWCSLYSALHNSSLENSVITDFNSWWQLGGQCQY